MSHLADGTVAKPGTVLLAGRYRLGALLGRGGMADVYRCRDEVLDRDVAVKLFRPGAAGEPNEQLRWRSEIRTLAQLHHANLVTLHDAGEDGDRLFFVMQLVDGTTLSRLNDGHELDPAEVARIGAALADALAYVHELGIVHRDVKPANVLLDASHQPYLTDFGIAHAGAATRLTAAGLAVGSAGYLAPEQVTGGGIEPATDVYALGLVLLECLTGHREYDGAPVEAALARLQREPQVPENLPGGWRALLSAMTAIESGSRPTAADVAHQLRGLAAGDTVASPIDLSTDHPLDARTSGPTPPATKLFPSDSQVTMLDAIPTSVGARSRRRGRLVASLIALVVVLVVALTWGDGNPKRPPTSNLAPSPSSGTLTPQLGTDFDQLEKAISG